MTDADVQRVYEPNIKGKPHVAVSFVPHGSGQLAIEGSERAQVVEEPIVPGEGGFVPPDRGDVMRTFHPATVMNFRLGGGGFASDLTQVLREQKGYTYGVGSGFSGSDLPGPFSISSAVRANVTLESLGLIKGMTEQHGPTFDADDLEATKRFLLKNNAMAFETLGAKLGILRVRNALGDTRATSQEPRGKNYAVRTMRRRPIRLRRLLVLQCVRWLDACSPPRRQPAREQRDGAEHGSGTRRIVR